MRLICLQEALTHFSCGRSGQETSMSSADLFVFHDSPIIPIPLISQSGHPLHRIQEVRIQQGMSLRTAARQLGTDVRTVRAQEDASSDLRLSDLYRWQKALGVPAVDLLEESGESLSRPVAERAKMVRLMKTAASLLETVESPSARRMAENLVQQLCDIMPELKEVSSWHTVGQRRSLDELGRAAEQVVDDSAMFGNDAYD